jgi:DNA-directed RNA polymerase specialized sigma24 family protein
LPGWILTTTRREVIRLAKRRQRERDELSTDGFDVPDPLAAAPDAALLRAEAHEHIRRAFGQLSERCQRLLGLLATDPPVTYRAIGATLGVPLGSVGPLRSRCLNDLRRLAQLPATNGAGGASQKRDDGHGR